MMDISLVKKHCRIEDDFTDDDDWIAGRIKGAIRYVENYTRRKMYSTENDAGYAEDRDALLYGEDIETAMLLLIGHWYENREAVNVGNITSALDFAVIALLQPYRIYGL
ncbi:head-tail connector protein [Serratia sp. M24T3]|uniref:head-tail connector protein n=1 Tax=Serratia sp. M24T3 TaxID=932213 RepID=UPI00025BAB1B|nr:head-tail connector protein [Serratia sp. M24T3]EIC82085.1 hypothetical protein SPM24T3_23652 [Serratia sp. M24T3]